MVKSFTVKSDDLYKLLSLFNKTLTRHNSLPILENILIEVSNNSMSVTGSDMELTLKGQLQTNTEEEFSLLVPRKLLTDLLSINKNVEAIFKLNTVNNVLTLELGTGLYTIVCQELSDFPKIKDQEYIKEIEVSFPILQQFISKTIQFLGHDSLRPAMTGIYLDVFESDLLVCCTDAYALGMAQTNERPEFQQKNGIVLPNKFGQLITNISYEGQILLQITFSSISVTIGNLSVNARLIDEKYPSFWAVLRKQSPVQIAVNKTDFLQSLKAVGLFTDSVVNKVLLEFKQNNLTLISENIDYAQKATNTIACEGDVDLNISLNKNYLAQIINQVDSDHLLLDLENTSKAVQICNDKFLWLLMPINSDKK